MNIDALKIFVSVVDKGSFAAVARDLDQDPSSVSRMIRSLEQQLGLRLFQRTTRKLTLSEAGAIYYDRVQPLLTELEQAKTMALEKSGKVNGLLRVTASAAFGQVCLMPVLPDFLRAYPDLKVDMMLSDARLDLLAERIDVAVRLGPLHDSSFVATKLFDSRYRVCASPDYLDRFGTPETPEDLENHDCIRLDLPNYRTRWTFKNQGGVEKTVAVNGRLMISNVLAVRRAAIDGLGVALLADWMTRDAYQHGHLVPLYPDFQVSAAGFDCSVSMIYPSKDYLPVKARVFIDFLKPLFKDSPG